MSAKLLLQILDRMPGVAYASRLDLTTGKMDWLYVSPKMGDLYGVPDAVLKAGPAEMIARIVPEDRAVLEQKMGECIQSLERMEWTGRIKHSSGQIRWLESQTVFERGDDGSILSYGQTVDVTERKKTEAALAESERARRASDALYHTVIEALPVGVIVLNPDGSFPVYNSAARKLVGAPPEAHNFNMVKAFGIFETDGKTPFPPDALPLERALAGEEDPEVELIVRNASLQGETWIHANGRPIRNEAGEITAAMVSLHNVGPQRALEQELRTRNEQLSASEETKTGLIERLRYAIDELSNPILEVWDDILVIPIIGVVDSRRTADMVQRLLAEVARTQAGFVIIDLTGVEIVDTKTADHLMKLVRKVEIVGARCVLTGIRPAVSETLVDIGVDLGRLTTLRNLKHGLREALRVMRREREGMRDLGDDDLLDDHRARQRGR